MVDRDLTGDEAQRALSEAMRRTRATAGPTPAELIAFVREQRDRSFGEARPMFSALLTGLERQQTDERAARGETRESAETIRRVAAHYFDKGRCSGHDQFNGRYCRDVAAWDQWCINCAGFMLLQSLTAETQARQEADQLVDIKIARLHEEAEAHQQAERALEEADRLVTLKDAHITDLSVQLTASEQALSAERARKVDLGLRLGQILGREYDGVPLDEVARRFVASKQSQKLWEYCHGLTADRLVEAEQSLASLRTALEKMQREKHDQAVGRAHVSTDYHYRKDGSAPTFEDCEHPDCAALLAAPRTDETTPR